MKKLISIAIFLSAASHASSQSAKQKRADRYYEKFAYASAASTYESVAERRSGSDRSLHRLAESYYNMGDLRNAEPWYKQLNAENKLSADEQFNYAQCLKWIGDYNEAQNILAVFAENNPTDLRAKDFIAKRELLAKIMWQDPKFSLINLDINTSQADFGPAFWGANVVFASAGRGGNSVKRLHTWNNKPFLNIYSGKRESKANQISEVKAFRKKINSKYHEGPVCFSADGNTMYFTRNNFFKGKFGKDSMGINNLKLYTATLKNEEWTNEKSLPFNIEDYSVGHPALSPDGKWLYFVSDVPGGFGGTDIYRVSIHADGSYGKPENIGNKINTEGNEMFPFVHANGSLFFSSNGQLGFGGLDVFQSAVTNSNQFGEPTNVGLAINSSADDFGFILDADEKSGYVSSNRDGGKGDDDIYAVTVLKALAPAFKLDGIARDKHSKEVLANTEVVLKDSQGTVIGTIITSDKGEYSFAVEPQQSYQLAAMHEGYYEQMKNVSTTLLTPDNTTQKEDVELDTNPKLRLIGLVLDKTTGQPIDGAKVTIVEKSPQQSFAALNTPASGEVVKAMDGKRIGDQLSYYITVEKNGYLTETLELTESVKGTDIKFRVDLDKLTVGSDLGKMIDIKPIYFDKDKDFIRTDASAELDKIVAVMQEYPEMVIELGSHTDCRASAAYNEKLSDRRAKSSAAYIVSKGIAKNRIYGKGYGESELVNDCGCEGDKKSTCSEEQHQLNRRTIFKIIKM